VVQRIRGGSLVYFRCSASAEDYIELSLGKDIRRTKGMQQTTIFAAFALSTLMLLGCASTAPTADIDSTPVIETEQSAPAIEVSKIYSEIERKQIFKEIVQAVDRGTKETELRFPDDIGVPIVFRYPDDIMHRIAIERELQEKYLEELVEKRKLTMDQLEEIALEGIEQQWPIK
jgi:hypothetical protein